MTTSRCGKCGSSGFELKMTSDIKGANYAYSFIQCSNCGTVVGVVDAHYVPSLLEKIATKLGFKLFN